MTQRASWLSVLSALVIAGCAEAAAPPPSTMYVADRTANRIVRFDGVTGEYQGEVAQVDRPSSMRLGPDGMLYVAGYGDSEVTRVELATGAQLDFYQNTEVLEEPVELVFRDRQLVVLGHDTHNAIVIDPSGAMVRDVGYPDMRGAHDFVFGDDGLLYVATEHDVSLGTALQVWDVSTGEMVHRFGTLDQIANATGIVSLGGALYVTDYERGQLLRFDGDVPAVIATDLVHPISLELGLDGLFYVIDERGIHRLDVTGEYVELFVPKSADLVGPRGALFVAI